MAEEAGDTEFVSQLCDSSKQKAKEELGERNARDTVIAVQTLRQWVKEQPWLRTPTDFAFLLRFLRFRKFSQLEARKALEKFWTTRSSRPEWCRSLDPEDPLFQKVIKSGIFTCPAVRDKQNRRVIIMRFGSFDVNMIKKEGIGRLWKCGMLFYDWLSRDENVQQALPVRAKSMNAYNEPAFFDVIFAFISPFLSKKLKDRFHIHGRSLVKIYAEVGHACLPQEYLPDDYEGPHAGTLAQIHDAMLADMCNPEFRRYVMELSSDKYGVDKNRIPARSQEVGSYRKLGTD
ncbi:alpha-tocopherol transfer protein-like isoform X2 [Dreissena polymorpha]|uniref:alpha-tocopherol transfer protein-like isoform X2 n=1 Tax=Dreissena polymorpha TaxID=45954 RepID=UPI0022645D54|nr:alpha-tocopherol transfer protein-like isoform X2 [Dreissena polymorpha]